jgi:hypothetical protein
MNPYSSPLATAWHSNKFLNPATDGERGFIDFARATDASS